jgi:hypothetical protein
MPKAAGLRAPRLLRGSYSTPDRLQGTVAQNPGYPDSSGASKRLCVSLWIAGGPPNRSPSIASGTDIAGERCTREAAPLEFGVA